MTAAPAAPAQAAPPPNDAPTAPMGFEQVTAENGTPQNQQGIAELAEATADRNVPRCLGPRSFARTVWFVVPPASTPQEIDVEASGRTLDLVDLAAYVQGPNADPTHPSTNPPNACAGAGAGGADAAAEPTSGVTLRVPAGRAVLIQVGRRGPRRSADDERALLSLGQTPLDPPGSPLAGDVADLTAPAVHAATATPVPLADATITGEDPAEPPCPSLGSVWRRYIPRQGGPRLITVGGSEAATLTVFSGARPATANALDCVNRVGRGTMEMKVPTRTRKPIWIRIGTDQPPAGSSATLTVAPAGNALVVDGGDAGFDPTSGGPGGGFPSACSRADASRASLTGPAIAGRVKQLNKRGSLRLALNLKKGPVCDVLIQLVGRRGQPYASKQLISLRGGRSVVTLRRFGRLVRGSYRVQLTALSALGEHVTVRSSLKGRLT